MALAYDNSTDMGSPVSASSYTFSHTINGVSNLILLVGVQVESGSDSVTGITYNGVSMTRAKLQVSVNSDETLYLYYLIAPATGANNVVISLSSSILAKAVAASYTGAKQSGQPDSSSGATNASANTLTLTTTVVAANCWLVGYGGFAAGGTISAGAGTTLRASNGPKGWFDSNASVGVGSQSLIYNESQTNEITGVIASIPPASPSGGGLFFEQF